MSFLKAFATATSAAVIATSLGADPAEAGSRRYRPNIGTAIGVGAALGVLGALSGNRAFANPMSNAFNTGSGYGYGNSYYGTRPQCTTMSRNGRTRTVRCPDGQRGGFVGGSSGGYQNYGIRTPRATMCANGPCFR